METATETTPKEAIMAWAEKHGVTMRAEFVPLSQSRNKGEKHPTLNWKVAILKRRASAGQWVDGDEWTILTTDYSAGCGHCPGYEQRGGNDSHHRVVFECENGVKAGGVSYHGSTAGATKKPGNHPILPDFADVLYSLSMDASVIDAGGFESWAGDLGYDTDSRAAEAIYRACLDTALKMRAALGDAAMGELATATQDY